MQDVEEKQNLLVCGNKNEKDVDDKPNNNETIKNTLNDSFELKQKIDKLQNGEYFVWDKSLDQPVLDQMHTYVGYGHLQIKNFFCSGSIFFCEGFYLTLIPTTILTLKDYFKIDDLTICIINVLFFAFLAIGNFTMSQLVGKLTRLQIYYISFFIKLPSTLLLIKTKSLNIFTTGFVMIGFSLGMMVPIAMSTMTEITPIHLRAFVITFVWIFFSFAQFLTPFLMSKFMPTLETENYSHVLLIGIILTNLSLIISILTYTETPRHLLSVGKNDEAFIILEKMLGKKIDNETKEELLKSNNFKNNKSNANNTDKDNEIEKKNKIEESDDQLVKTDVQKDISKTLDNKYDQEKTIFLDRLSSESLKSDKGLRKLFSQKYFNITMIASVLWVLNAMIFYGPSLILTITIEKLSRYYNLKEERSEAQIAKNANADVVNSLYYYAIAGAISLIFSAIISEIKYIGRRGSLILTYGFAFVFGLLMILIPIYFIPFFLAFSFFSTIGYNIMSSYTSELFSTDIRDTAMGYFFFINRIGAILSQFLFLQLFYISLTIPYIILFILALASSITSYMFPYDTLGMSLDKIK